MKKQQWSYGLIRFCSAKELNISHVVNLFINEYGLIGEDKDEIINHNWKKFASFINTKLLKGEIKGKQVSVSNGSSEYERYIRLEYLSHPIEVRNWWTSMSHKSKGKDGILQKYFNLKGLHFVQKNGGESQITKNISRYNAIKDADLLEDFKQFLNTID